jgi:hypothetical protein
VLSLVFGLVPSQILSAPFRNRFPAAFARGANNKMPKDATISIITHRIT